jgi:hypothetical protein
MSYDSAVSADAAQNKRCGNCLIVLNRVSLKARMFSWFAVPYIPSVEGALIYELSGGIAFLSNEWPSENKPDNLPICVG